ncbi:MAG: hypothetical protein KatS3mg131_2760 [Candidatus Tectimicrobiota bacterium]|nr:MAG: hypothetical protein KatS3mg131_2760 [Candidatus Tectomicrobia bacterium]
MCSWIRWCRGGILRRLASVFLLLGSVAGLQLLSASPTVAGAVKEVQGFYSVQSELVHVKPGQLYSAIATCDSFDQVIGGGFFLGGEGAILTGLGTRPRIVVNRNYNEHSWLVVVDNPDTETVVFNAQARCAKVKPHFNFGFP